MESRWISLRAGGPEAYASIPPSDAVRGAVVVGMEIFGVTAHVREICEHLAREGYAAVAPDFHWRHGRRRELDYDAADREEGMRLTRALRREEVLSDVADARAFALRHAPQGAGTAAIGFSLGGHLVTLAATRTCCIS